MSPLDRVTAGMTAEKLVTVTTEMPAGYVGAQRSRPRNNFQGEAASIRPGSHL